MSESAGHDIQPLRVPPKPSGHYAPVVRHGDIAYISGQLPIDASGRPLGEAPFEDQVHQVLANLQVCLESEGLTPQQLIQVRVYVTDIADWPQFDAIYSAWIGVHRPSRAVVGVSQLHYGVAPEMEAIASLIFPDAAPRTESSTQ